MSWTSTLELTCPYCGTISRYHDVILSSFNKLVLFCDPEMGGCDRPFVVTAKVMVKTSVQRIEGESDEEKKPEKEEQ